MNELERPQPARPPGASRTLPRLGIAITGLWLVALAAYLFWKQESVLALPPNEFGDFLAGAFAPLAFLWLVLGFFQQGEELRNSGDALWLQGRELQHSVEQQRELVNVTREQLKLDGEVLEAQRREAEWSARPVLDLGLGMNMRSDVFAQEFILRNHGRTCTRVVLEGFGQTHRTDSLTTESPLTFQVKLGLGGDPRDYEVEVTYLDARLTPGAMRFLVHWSGHGFRSEPFNP